MSYDFYADHEKTLIQQFLKNKYVILQGEDQEALFAVRKKIADITAEAINHANVNDNQIDSFLNHIHQLISVDKLNDIRLKVITEMNRDPWFRKAYFNAGRNSLMTLVGNELAMQRRINLSIQLPNDDSSLLPVHADVWAGDSPFEIVMWIPLVNCYATKSMYIADAEVDEAIQADFRPFKNKSSEDLYQAIEKNAKFLEVPFGSILLFSQNVMHGNRINREPETRWSMNCRFKSILTPFQGKKMGEFFEPITVRPITRLGLDYRLPEGLHE
jgi:sporadic carbohydrate cluster 2OG-Fe(II) oxygenase